MANAMNAGQQMAQLAAQQALQISQNGAMLSQAMTGRVARFMLDTSAEEAVGFAKEVSADLSSKLADLGGQLASLQEQAKVAMTTPPQTGTGGAFGSETGLSEQVGLQVANLSQQLAAIQAMLGNAGGGGAKP